MKRFFQFGILLLMSIVSLQAQTFPENNTVYRLINTVRENVVIAEDYGNNKLVCTTKGDSKAYSQLWLFQKSGEGWSMQNIFTGRYVQIESSNSKLYHTDLTPATFYVSRNNNFAEECYNILNQKNGNYGIHCETDYDVVPWYSASTKFDGSEWMYERVNITNEEISIARLQYEDFNNVLANKDSIYAIYKEFFTDESCSELKSEYLTMSDEDLEAAMNGCGSTLIGIAKKVKNNSWAAREKEFRVNSYGPYADIEYWAKKLKTKAYSWLNNPTGICANSGDILYIFVAEEPKDGATLELDVVKDNNHTGKRTKLKKGLNILTNIRDKQSLFIVYTADTRNKYTLADFDSIPIHIEGGYVNGYWDKDRHNDADWVDITRNHAKHPYIFIKGSHQLLFMKRDVMISSDVCPNTITDAIGWWDKMIEWEQSIMGLEEYRPSRYNNKPLAVSTSDGFMSAGYYTTNFTESSLHDIMSIKDIMEESGHCWGPAHENGHVHQEAIDMISCTESSNNLFSNIVLFNLGKFATWGLGVADCAQSFEEGLAWPFQNIGLQMRLYFQLYLYYHVAGNDPQFYPKLFKLLRDDPMKKLGNNQDNYGQYDLLHFAEKCCEASGHNLTSFFEAYGFFVPMSRVSIDMYGTWILSSTKRSIDNAKKEMAKYPQGPAIQFIEDRAAYMKRTDGGEGYKLEFTLGQYGEIGQYTAYLPDSLGVIANGYKYTKVGGKVKISGGKGAVGFKIYDTDSNLLTFATTHTIMLSDKNSIKDVRVVAVSANGTEVDVISKANGSEAEQLEELKDVLEGSKDVLKYKDSGNKYVGFFYETVLLKLEELVAEAQTALDNSDQSVHTYGEWAKLLADEITNIYSQEDTRVKIHSGNSYELSNAEYTGYIMYNDNGKITSKRSGMSTKFKSFTFTSTGKENEYYLSNTGAYIDHIGVSSQATAKSTAKNKAIKFIVGEYSKLGIAKYYIHQTGEERHALHSASNHHVVGWDYNVNPSLWYLVATNQVKEKADEKSLKVLISEATSIYDLIVDTTVTDKITFVENIEVISNTLAADVEAMMSLVSESNDAIGKKYYNFYPKLIESLTAAISTVRAGYSTGTGINGVYIDGKESRIYDINGRKVDEVTSSGLYIVDGKKVFINK